MQIRSIALLAMFIGTCLQGSSLSGLPLAIYYSFDAPPSAALVTGMQTELDRILEDGGVRVVWRAVESPRNAEDFQGIVVLRFHGECFWPAHTGPHYRADSSDGPLAKTEVADGRVLPFGSVDCDRLRNLMAPALKTVGPVEQNVSLGRAIARVSAHEIYHMLTGSGAHARRGIARASHSLADLTAPTFAFAPQQTAWLRAWGAKSSRQLSLESPEVAMKPPEAQSDAFNSTGR